MTWAVKLTLEIDEGFDEPLDVIKGITESVPAIERSLRQWVGIARSKGHSWQEIGDALGVTRQSAAERFSGAEEEFRKQTIRSVLGSLRRPHGVPTTDQIRRQMREEEEGIELRKWGALPPGLKWRS